MFLKPIFASFLFLFLSLNVHASFIRLNFSEFKGTLISEEFTVTQIQPKLTCEFVKPGKPGALVQRRYPQGQITAQGNGRVDIYLESSSLTEWLPGFEINSCAYMLIVLGEKKSGVNVLKDIVLMGKERGQMEPDELEFMQDSEQANRYLQKKLNPLKIGL